MLKTIQGAVGVLVFGAVFASLVYVFGLPWVKAKELPFKEGDCIKMNFDGVESWHYGMVSRIESIGKDNYGVKYWLEFGWSTGVGTIPFTVNVSKVVCPQITEDQNGTN